MFQSAIAAAGDAASGPVVSVPISSCCCDLLELLGGVSDGRPGRGRDHPVAVVLSLAAAAAVAGMGSFTAIAGWVADVSLGVLTDLYERAGSTRMPAAPPSKATIWRVVTGADAAAVDAAIGNWLTAAAAFVDRDGPGDGAGQRPTPVRVDGKTVRGAKDTDGNQVHLLAALVGDVGVVAAQTEVEAKTNEVPMLPPLLDTVDVAGAVVTADALHTVRATAEYLHKREADFVFPVKENRPRLFAALDNLPWRDVPISHTATDRGHGRVTTRTIQVQPAPDHLPFPHVNQVFLLERHVSDLRGEPLSAVAVLGVTSLTATRASPARLAGYIQGQWAIESLHWLRDTLYREDHSTARTRSGPRIMAGLRNLAIGAHHLAGRHDTTEATRWACRRPDRPFTILRLAQ